MNDEKIKKDQQGSGGGVQPNSKPKEEIRHCGMRCANEKCTKICFGGKGAGMAELKM